MGKGENVSQSRFASIVGVTTATVRSWAREGMPVAEAARRGGATQINTAAAVEWLLDRAAGKQQPKAASSADLAEGATLVRRVLAEEGRAIAAAGITLDDAKTAETVLRARERALSIEIEEGRLLPKDEVVRHVAGAFRNFREGLLQLPARVGAQMAAEVGAPVEVVDRALTAVLRDYLDRLSAPEVRG